MATNTQEKQQHRTPTKSSRVFHTTRESFKVLVAFWTKFNNDWSWNNAAGLAYNLILAMFPLVIALLSILGLFLGTLNAQAYEQIRSQLISVFSSMSGSQEILNAALKQLKNNAGILAGIAIVFSLFNGSRLFVFMEGALDIIYHAPPRSLIGQNVMAFVMLLLFVLIAPIMILTSAGPAFVFSILKATPLVAIPGIPLLFSLGGIFGGLLASYILFQVIYMVVPNKKIVFRNSWRGAVFAAILLELYLTLFPLYTVYFLRGFGSALGLLILLIFFYYFAMILFLGAEVNAFFAEKIRSTPYDVTTMMHVMTSRLLNDEKERKVQPAEGTEDEAPSTNNM